MVGARVGGYRVGWTAQSRMGGRHGRAITTHLDVELQADDMQQRRAGRQVDEQIDIAALSIDAPSDRTEDTHNARASRCGEIENAAAM